MRRSRMLVGGAVVMMLVGAGAGPEGAAAKTGRQGIAEEQVKVAREALEVGKAMYGKGLIDYTVLSPWQHRLIEAQLATEPGKEKVLQLLQEDVKQAKQFERLAEQRYKAGMCSQLDVLQARWGRLEAEMRLDAAGR